jgi:hypothetical protein
MQPPTSDARTSSAARTGGGEGQLPRVSWAVAASGELRAPASSDSAAASDAAALSGATEQQYAWAAQVSAAVTAAAVSAATDDDTAVPADAAAAQVGSEAGSGLGGAEPLAQLIASAAAAAMAPREGPGAALSSLGPTAVEMPGEGLSTAGPMPAIAPESGAAAAGTGEGSAPQLGPAPDAPAMGLSPPQAAGERPEFDVAAPPIARSIADGGLEDSRGGPPSSEQLTDAVARAAVAEAESHSLPADSQPPVRSAEEAPLVDDRRSSAAAADVSSKGTILMRPAAEEPDLARGAQKGEAELEGAAAIPTCKQS